MCCSWLGLPFPSADSLNASTLLEGPDSTLRHGLSCTLSPRASSATIPSFAPSPQGTTKVLHLPLKAIADGNDPFPLAYYTIGEKSREASKVDNTEADGNRHGTQLLLLSTH